MRNKRRPHRLRLHEMPKHPRYYALPRMNMRSGQYGIAAPW